MSLLSPLIRDLGIRVVFLFTRKLFDWWHTVVENDGTAKILHKKMSLTSSSIRFFAHAAVCMWLWFSATVNFMLSAAYSGHFWWKKKKNQSFSKPQQIWTYFLVMFPNKTPAVAHRTHQLQLNIQVWQFNELDLNEIQTNITVVIVVSYWSLIKLTFNMSPFISMSPISFWPRNAPKCCEVLQPSYKWQMNTLSRTVVSKKIRPFPPRLEEKGKNKNGDSFSLEVGVWSIFAMFDWRVKCNVWLAGKLAIMHACFKKYCLHINKQDLLNIQQVSRLVMIQSQCL